MIFVIWSVNPLLVRVNIWCPSEKRDAKSYAPSCASLVPDIVTQYITSDSLRARHCETGCLYHRSSKMATGGHPKAELWMGPGRPTLLDGAGAAHAPFPSQIRHSRGKREIIASMVGDVPEVLQACIFEPPPDQRGMTERARQVMRILIQVEVEQYDLSICGDEAKRIDFRLEAIPENPCV
jgi:hypothetical protein